MAIVYGDKEARLPIKGINTEANPIHFPIDEGYAVDILNMVVDFDPLSLRARWGLQSVGGIKISASRNAAAGTNNQAFTAFLWERVNDDADTHFLCVQHVDALFFYSIDGPSTANIKTSAINLDDVKSGTTKGTSTTISEQPLSYTRVKGSLLICSGAIDPTIIEFDPVADTFTASKINIKVRDIWGMDSQIEVDKRPAVIGDFPAGVTASSTYAAISESHEYNLYNQGWYQDRKIVAAGAFVDPIAQFNTVNAEYPSNSDVVFIGMVESSGDLIFDADWLKQQTFGSSPAPRGHYVVDAFNIDRDAILNAPDASGGFTGGGGGLAETGNFDDIPFFTP